MKTTTIASLAIVVGVVAVGLYLLTRGSSSAAGAGGGMFGGGAELPAQAEGAQYISAVGGAIGDVLSGIGGLYGQAASSSTGGGRAK